MQFPVEPGRAPAEESAPVRTGLLQRAGPKSETNVPSLSSFSVIKGATRYYWGIPFTLRAARPRYVASLPSGHGMGSQAFFIRIVPFWS